MKLADQIVLVTGSSRGLGLAVARAFRAQGARVVLNYVDARSAPAADAAAAELDALAVRADVTDPGQVRALFAAAARHHDGRPITTVVNNALPGGFRFDGDAGRTRLADLEWDAFDRQLQGAVRGALNTTQAALGDVGATGDIGAPGGLFCIVNIGSNLVSNPVVPYQDYTAAKGALLAFTRTTAAELGPFGVRCNMVSGGLLRTTDASRSTPEAVFEAVGAATPLRRVTTPEDVAGAVVFFASEWAAGVTGQNINVDGGLVMT